MSEKEKIIHEIAEEFVKTHNPNNWNGIGEPNKDFSEELEQSISSDFCIFSTIFDTL